MREKVMQTFYQIFVSADSSVEFDASQALIDAFNGDVIDDVPIYATAIYSFGLDHYDEIKEEISKHLVNWTFERLDNVAKAILFVGISEGTYVQGASKNVVINECVKLAKNYLKSGDHRFINAVLDKSIPVYVPKDA